MSKKLLFKGGHAIGMTPYEIEDFSSLHIRDPRVDEKTKAYIDSVIGNSVLNLCPYRNVLVTHKYDTVEGNVVTLDDCEDDEIIQLSEIQGNTMVNCNKDTDKELILMPNLDTNGYSNVTLTQGIDGGKVDVSLEGNTMVNVCDQEEAVAITKSYTVETGNHIALQGEYDGKCRPNIYGNTLVNLSTVENSNVNGTFKRQLAYPVSSTITIICHNLKDFKIAYSKEQDGKWIGNTIISGYKNVITLDSGVTVKELIAGNTEDYNNITYEEFQNLNIVVLEGDYTNKPIPDYFTGMKSSFEDKLITDENDANNGKYKVDYKVTGKNKFDSSMPIAQKRFLTKIKKGQSYTLSYDYAEGNTGDDRVQLSTSYIFNQGENGEIIDSVDYAFTRSVVGRNTITITSTIDGYLFMRIVTPSSTLKYLSNFQLEEGTTATTYEPYKESIKTLYLNSPLLEGDTIEQSGNNIIHNHRYKEVVLDGSEDELWYLHNNTGTNCNEFRCTRINNKDLPLMSSSSENSLCDKYITASSGDKERFAWGGGAIYLSILKTKIDYGLNELREYLNSNPVTCIGELATPTQEIISTNDNLLLDSYTNGHLDVDTIVPIDKVVFKANYKSLKYLYPNTEYIIQFESDNVGELEYYMGGTAGHINVVKGINKINCTTNDTIKWLNLDLIGIGFNMSKIVVTPKVDNDFGYFKGMKSVGECEGNKIEILSRNKNLFELDWYMIKKNTSPTTNGYYGYRIKFKPNTYYYITCINDLGIDLLSHNKYCYINTNHGSMIWVVNKSNGTNGNNSARVQTGADGYINFRCSYYTDEWLDDLNKIKIQIEETTSITQNASSYIEPKQNKKEILLTEPLRGLPNGVKDKYVIIDGKWYIERNVGIYSMANITDITYTPVEQTNPNPSIGFWVVSGVNDFFKLTKYKENTDNNNVCNVLPSAIRYYNVWYDTDSYGLIWSDWFTNNRIGFRDKRFPTAEYKQEALNFFKTVQFSFELETPTYEPIDYNPFEVYTDTTHISNNSTIPCNMVIKNSGFNCILKPNTKYTVSSSNGLSTVTTKDSIGDSVLRFYDKDTTSITKMNKVLVLEGDYITGNPPIPAFFKGMESAFEQELVTDENDEHYGKYKVEVKAVGKNLFDGKWEYGSINQDTGNNDTTKAQIRTTNYILVKPNTTYIASSSKLTHNNVVVWCCWDKDYNYLQGSSTSKIYTTPSNAKYIKVRTFIVDEQNISLSCPLQIEQGNQATEYEPYKENNITFYINEPLRGVGDIKDKVYVKEDKVVVERNCASATLDGSENWNGFILDDVKSQAYSFKLNKAFGYNNIICENKSTNQTTYVRNVDEISGTPNNKAIWVSMHKRFKTLEEFKSELSKKNLKVVYQLATPTYEEVECDLSKLALEGYNHGTLFYNSNIPVTTQFYDFNVNIKDMLIPNETYYITFIADRVKDITINLSGVQVNYKTSMGYNKVPVQLGDVVNTNFSMDSRGVELSDLMISTSTSLIYVKDMNDVCIYDEANNKYSITITSTGGNESDKRVILLDYPLLRLNKDIYDRLYYNNKDSRYRIDKKVFKHKFTNDREYSKYAAETNDTYYSSFISFDETIKDYVIITNEKVKTVKVENDKYYFKIKWSDLGVSDKTEVNGNQGMKDFFNNNEVYLYYATDGFVEIVDGLRRQTLKMYQPETTINFLGNTTTTVTIVIPKKNI